MIYEGVWFSDEAIKGMPLGKFIAMHKDAFWTDRDEKTRTRMLTEVHGIINPPKRGRKKTEK